MGAKPDKENGEYGWTPLDLAMRFGEKYLVKLLRDCLEQREANRNSRHQDKSGDESDEEEEDEEEEEEDLEEDEDDSDFYHDYDDYISPSDLGKGKVQTTVLEYFVRSIRYAPDLDMDSPSCFDLGRQKQTLITKYFIRNV